MEHKEMIFGEEASNALIAGVNKVANAVKTTMGPGGRTVVIGKIQGQPRITKDGVSVAKSIVLENPYENMGAQIMKRAASQTCDIAGDGPQPLYSKILTPTGWTTMGEVKAGDQICGTRGTTQTVMEVFDKGTKQVYEVCFQSGRTVHCCEDHTWTVNRRNYGLQNITVNEMLREGIKEYHKGYERLKFFTPHTTIEFNEQEVPIDPFTLGVILGDGFVGDGFRNVEIWMGYSKADRVVSRLVFPKGIKARSVDIESRNSIRLTILGKTEDGRKITDLLDKLDLISTKSHERFIPECYLFNSKKVREAILAGLLATDGYINKRGRFEFSTTSERLANDVLALCRSLGYFVGLSKNEKSGKYIKRAIYRIREQKASVYGDKIIDIKRLDSFEPMRCIKVSNEDELYITDNFILTHNTTSSSVLAQAIIEAAKRKVEPNQMISVCRDFPKVVEFITGRLKKIAKPVKKKDILNVATISANNDAEVGKLIADAYDIVDDAGVISVSKSESTKTYVSVTDGFNITSGYYSQYFVTDRVKDACVFEDAIVVVVRGKMTNIKSVKPAIDMAMKENIPLVFIVEDIDDACSSILVQNRINAGFKTCVIKAPGFAENREYWLEDCAVKFGCHVFNLKTQMPFDRRHFGYVQKISIYKNNAVAIVNTPDAYKSVIEMHIASLKDEDRIARFKNKVGVIKVGGNNDLEVSEKIDRIDDALCAVRSAVAEGIVPGGGRTLMKISEELPDGLVYDIFKDALNAPYLTMIENAGLEDRRNELKDKPITFGHNIKNDELCNLFRAGIVDPVKVTRVSLENATSVASLVLTTGCALNTNIIN